MIGSLVDTIKSAFIYGRSIADNIIAAEELIFDIQKRNLKCHIFKVDLSKTFDMIDWGFLFDVLTDSGFGAKWISWIWSILHTSKANILINGSSSGYVLYQRWLQQSDPFSTPLFVLVGDALSAMCFHALSSRVLSGFPSVLIVTCATSSTLMIFCFSQLVG